MDRWLPGSDGRSLTTPAPEQPAEHGGVQVAGGADGQEVGQEPAAQLQQRLAAADGGVDVEVPERLVRACQCMYVFCILTLHTYLFTYYRYTRPRRPVDTERGELRSRLRQFSLAQGVFRLALPARETVGALAPQI